jgi:MFS family permease
MKHHIRPMAVGPPPYRRFAWFIAFLLFAGSVVNYIDRAVLAYVMPQVRHDFSLTNTDYGLVVNAFLVTYTIFYILGGRLSDRLGCRRSFTITLVFWSLASMALAPPAVAWITVNYGWRASFLVTGAVGLLLVPPWLLLHRRIQQRYGERDPAPAGTLEQGARPTGEEDLSLFEVLKTRKY